MFAIYTAIAGLAGLFGGLALLLGAPPHLLSGDVALGCGFVLLSVGVIVDYDDKSRAPRARL